MSRGYVIIAQNNGIDDYIKCAETLAMSLLWVMPDANVSLITNAEYQNTIFDHVIKLPYGDRSASSWKLANDWQVYDASPYHETIKLEADMFIPTNIDFWWDTLSHQDMVICTTIRDFKQNISKVRTYRSFIYDNNLPDTYNAITYFKKSPLAERFFKIVRDIFENWEEYKIILRCDPKEPVTTDWAYAIASNIIGADKTTMPVFDSMSMIHMKRFVNDLYTEVWTDSLVYEITTDSLRLNTYPQRYPFHYYVKSFANKLAESTY